MHEINFDNKQHVHFTGIGGISMSGLAEILLSRGFTVSGSDSSESKLTRRLVKHGAKISYQQVASNITSDVDVVVYTAAVKEDNPELVSARAKNIPTLTRAEFLGQIMKNFNTAIGVSGTHGKTTTTSMISQILIQNNSDPTILVGGIMKSIGGNIHIGKSDLMITEACEYTNSFLSFFPTMEVVLNICEDHMDFFKDIDDIRNSFKKYTELLPEDGTLIINGAIDDLDFFTRDLKCNVATFGFDASYTYSIANIEYNNFACSKFDILYKGEKIGRVHLKVPGEHNALNAIAAIAACRELGISMDTIKAGLTIYTGTDRRFQYKGVFNKTSVIDDYAHHPDEIRATLTTAKDYPHNHTWCVFQPHTYTRTKAFLHDFATSLSLADHVILAPIYAARETDTLGISSLTLLEELKALNVDAYYFETFEEIEEFIKNNVINDDLLITMGAGDIVLVGEHLVSH